MSNEAMSWKSLLDQIHWNADGLVPVIAQEANTLRVLMMAWMNRESLSLTMTEGRTVYWSRSRQKLWRKGEESGHIQYVKDIMLDCDNDTILVHVEQVGGKACHTGRVSCFFQHYRHPNWKTEEDVEGE